MKILFILPEYFPHSGGGISTYYLQYIRALKPHVAHIKVIVGSGYTQTDKQYELDGIEVSYLKPEKYQHYFDQFQKFEIVPDYRRNIAAAWAMWDQANKGEDFDLIECTDFGLGFIPWLISPQHPVVVRLHGSGGQIDLHEKNSAESLVGDFNRHTEHLLLNKANLLITHSISNLDFWNKILPDQQIKLIPPIFLPSRNKYLNFNQKQNTGIVCARIQEWKGPDVLCEAISLITKNELIIDWYGRDTIFSGQQPKSVQLKTKYPKIWGIRIKLHDVVANKELMEIQQRTKYAIIPSTWDMYNFTCLEYMNAGTLVICSEGAGVSTLIEHGVNGFKFPNRNAEALAECIETVLSLDEKTYQSIVQNAHHTLESELGVEKLIQQQLRIYQEIKASFTKKESNAFIEALYEPSTKKHQLSELLAKQPLKVLAKHFLCRLSRKLIK